MIYLKRKYEIDYLLESGKIVGDTLFLIRNKIKEGITTKELNNIAEKNISKYKATPSFKDYRGFPFSICASKNEELVHGFPDDTPLKNNDIITIDIGALKNNFHGDASITCSVSETPTKEVQDLLTVTKQCLYMSIEHFIKKSKVGDIANVIHKIASVNGYKTIKTYGGHGIGRILHEDPFIPNEGRNHMGYMFHEGSAIAIEPILTKGNGRIKTKNDGWTVITEDKELTAHFEHTVCLTENGPVITTKNE